MRRFILYVLCLPVWQTVYSQDNNNVSDSVGKIVNFPFRFIELKYTHLDAQITRQSEKYLQRLAKQEEKLKRKLSKFDSKVSKNLNGGNGAQKFYGELVNKVKFNKDSLTISGEYLPYIDSVQTSLAFLKHNKQFVSKSKDYQQKLQGALAQVKQFQSKLQQTERVKEYIRQRRELIREQLKHYTSLPNSIKKCYTDYSKEFYYYTTKLKEYKDIANDPDKLTQKALAILRESKPFQRFAQEFGQLASVFSIPPNYGNTQNLAGLQTRIQVQNLIASTGQTATQVLTQNLQAAHTQLKNKIDEKLNSLGNGGVDKDMPDFKPDNQKTKCFWKRLEYGSNFQTTKNKFFPTTSDLGLSIGYKINDKSTIGVGASYKMGWGKDIKHITITHQGMGLRSFLDIKLKGSFFASGGFEYNYIPISADSLSSSSGMYWKDVSSWQQSGMIGISKIVSIKSKFFKKTKLQLLWDFLSYQQVPRAQPLIFRIGQLLK